MEDGEMQLLNDPRRRVFQHHIEATAAKRKKGGPILVGKTADGNVTVSYGRKLGDAGKALAEQFLAAAQAEYEWCQSVFAATPGAPVQVIIRKLSGQTNGDGGAYHYGCDFTSGGVLYLDTTQTAAEPLSMEIGLFQAELSECYMGAQAKGWNCGGSNGEGLSRFLAELRSGGASGALAAFTTAPSWIKAEMPDWCSKTEATDQNPVSTGCAVLYCWWMTHEGKTPAEIAGAGGATLQDNFAALGGGGSCYDALKAAVAAPPGPVTSDNPWQI
jgi:hypothetical protein